MTRLILPGPPLISFLFFTNKINFKPILTVNMYLRSFLITFFFLVLFTLTSSMASARMMSVKGEKVRLRSGPGKQYSVRWEYGTGFPLKILSKKNGWFKVSDFERDTGWIKQELLSSTPHMVVKVNRKKSRKINIRSGPGTRFKIVGKAYYGVVFKTIKQTKGWANVKHESGLTGWINGAPPG